MFLKRLCCCSRLKDHLSMDLRLLIIVFLLKWSHAQGSHPPRITEHPTDTTVPRHDPATLNCKAEGSPAPTLQWYKDGVPLKILPGSHRIALPAGGLFFLKVVNSRRESDAGIYWCEAKNELGVARSRNASLHVAVLRDEFRLEPQNTRIAQGDTALLECAAPRGVPEPTVTWKKGGQKLDLDSSKRIRVVDGGNLAIQDARQSDEGQYQCIAKNPVGVRESVVAMLKVNVKPFIIRGPYDQTVLEGSSVTFPCRVGGDPMPDVLWLRTASGGNMPLDRVSVLEDRSLRLERVTAADEGEYSCEADNAVGAISAMGTLTVLAPPKFVQRPTSKSVELGADTSLECRAIGNPRPTIIWTIKNNRSLIIPGAPPLDRLQSINSEDGHSILTITKFQRSDKDLVLICNAINEVGTITARAQLTLDSQEDRPPPIIIAGPVNQTLPVKSLATLQCKAIGLPNPTISWYRDGIPVHPTVKVNITSAGDLIISDLDRQQDQGLYTCVASSRTGKSTWSGYLRIEVPTNPNIKFYRAPDPTKYPTAPGQPRLLNASATSVTLVWASSDKIGAAPLLGYAVEMFSTNKSKTWIPLAARLNDPIFTVDALTPGAAYMFIVRAENSYGFSPPSAISEVILAGRTMGSNGRLSEDERDPLLGEVESLLSTNDVVELLEANATDATTVRLAWDIDSGQYIEGFYIYARELHRAEYKLMTILNAADGGGPSACAVQGLQKATMYEFFLVPFYKSVVGKPSNAKYARTMEDVPEAAPHNMEAIQFNKTSVFLKWQPPQPNRTRNGVLTSYNVIVNGLDSHNTTRIYKNMTIDAVTPTLLLANLTSGVTYYIAVAAATKVGIGPFSQPAVLRMDPRTQSLDTGFTRYPINRDIADDFLTQTWFIILLGSIIAIIVFLFGALVLFKRYQFIKQTSLGSLHGNHAIGSVRKFPTLPLNTNGVWIDPTGGVWRQATTCTTKEPLPDYSQVTGQQTLALPDYERLTPLNMPDYAEVACSTFKNPHGPPKTSPNKSGNALQTSGGSALYDSFGAYATTNLVANAKLYQHRYAATATSTKTATTKWLPQYGNNNNSNNSNSTTNDNSNSTSNSNNNKQLQHDDYRAAGMYSAPPSAYYGVGSIGGGGGGGGGGTYFSAMDTVYPALVPLQQDKMTVSTASTAILASPAKSSLKNNAAAGGGSKINITENRMEHLNHMAGGNTNNTAATKATSGSSADLPPRYNPFNGASAPPTTSSASASAAARQQLLSASHVLKQGLGAYANTTLAAQMANGGGVGTLRRQRNPKVCKSENNINFGNLYSSNNPAATAGAGSKATVGGNNSSIGQPDFLTGGSNNDNDNADDFSSTNHLLNDWASSSSIAADQHFGSKQPSKQHLYVKAKDGTWSAVPSDAYQNFKHQQQQQQHQLLGAGEHNQSTKSTAETKSTPNPTHLNSSLNNSSSVSSSSSHSFNSSVGSVTAIAQANNKFFSSYGQSDNV